MSNKTLVYRKPAPKPPYDERMLMWDAGVVTDYTWKWFAADKFSPTETKLWTHKNDKEARERFEAEVAALVAAGWMPVPDWPGKSDKPIGSTAGSGRKREPKKKPKKAKPLKRITLAKLVVRGRVPRVKEAELAALERKVTLPADWLTLVRTHGVRAFANLVRITKPARVVADTKRWVKFWAVDHDPVWKNFGDMVPEPKQLVLVASSSNGDVVGYTGTRYVIFPRSKDTAVGVADLAEVFGWFMAAIEEAGNKARPTYAPET